MFKIHLCKQELLDKVGTSTSAANISFHDFRTFELYQYSYTLHGIPLVFSAFIKALITTFLCMSKEKKYVFIGCLVKNKDRK